DLDHFKHVNDTLGHSAGDELIVKVADLIASRVRETDIVARLGGDEFAVILPNHDITVGEHVAGEIAGVLRTELASGTWGALPVTASIGIAAFTADAPADQVLIDADLAMYEAKEAGGDQVAPHQSTRDQRPRVAARIDWVRRISHALEHDRLRIVSQPILNRTTNKPEMHELLIRMLDDHDNLITPGSFIDIAERYDLVQRIDRFVIDRAAALLANTTQRRRAVAISANVSAKTIADPTLLDYAA